MVQKIEQEDLGRKVWIKSREEGSFFSATCSIGELVDKTENNKAVVWKDKSLKTISKARIIWAEPRKK